jgi:aldose 1-epimerase
MPSGEQHEIRHGDQRAVIVEVGGGLRSYGAGGLELLDGYGPRERCAGGRGQVLIPWPNRLREGRYEFDGEGHQLPLNELETRTAIHGLVRWANWDRAEGEPDRIVMRHVLHPQPGWPGTLQLRIEYALGDAGLAVTTHATNVGLGPCPFGAGAHPYLTLGTATVDSLTLQATAGRYLEADEQGIPVGEHDVAGTPFDLRTPRKLGEARLDHAFSDLERDQDGIARVRIATPDGSRAVALWVDPSYRYLMLFTGDTLPAPRRRRGLAVEPMTCPPNALQSGRDLVRLDPGESFTGRWGISPGS